MMKVFSLSFFILVSLMGTAQKNCPIIPQPLASIPSKDQFKLDRYSSIKVSDPKLNGIANYLRDEIRKNASIELAMQPSKNGSMVSLVLTRSKTQNRSSAEAYSIDMNKGTIMVAASSEAGLFNGVTSLLQLVRMAENKGGILMLDCWQIMDAPGYGWRGLMLDESRHFFGLAKLKSLIDWMAFYKLNRFHWHLTDEPGWRMEVKKYPKLTTVGGVGNFSDSTAPARYYTQDQIKELVAYAAERFISVIPEIDMPGHATAANRAYPEFSGGGSKAHPEFTFNPGKEATYSYLTDILKETASLFPASMIHLGGDEVNFGNQQWPLIPGVKSLMAEKKMKDLNAMDLDAATKIIAGSARSMGLEVVA